MKDVELRELLPGRPFKWANSVEAVPYVLLKPHHTLKQGLSKGVLLVANLETGFTYPAKPDTKVVPLHNHTITWTT